MPSSSKLSLWVSSPSSCQWAPVENTEAIARHGESHGWRWVEELSENLELYQRRTQATLRRERPARLPLPIHSSGAGRIAAGLTPGLVPTGDQDSACMAGQFH